MYTALYVITASHCVQIGHFLPLSCHHQSAHAHVPVHSTQTHKLSTKGLGRFSCREVPMVYDPDHILQTTVIPGAFGIISKNTNFVWFFDFCLVLFLDLRQIGVLVIV